jgi:hypothetical protein
MTNVAKIDVFQIGFEYTFGGAYWLFRYLIMARIVWQLNTIINESDTTIPVICILRTIGTITYKNSLPFSKMGAI